MGFFDHLLRRRGASEQARRAELRGDLVRAIELWAEAGEGEEVARVMILRGDAEPDPRQRLQHYVQAATSAPPASPIARQARVKRASLTVALAGDGAVSSATRGDLLAAARELEELGEADLAASAYALVRDTEGEARALAQAGQVERLETLLDAEHDKRSEERHRSAAYAEVESLVATGRRREALAAAARLATEAPLDASARERVQAIEARRVAGGVSRILLSGTPWNVIVDDEVVLGRTEGSVRIASAALSRRHMALARAGDGGTVRDLGSRNGTTLRGMRLAGALPVGDGLSLLLGGEVKLEVAPSAAWKGAFDLEVGGVLYVAFLGAAHLAVGSWRLERGVDGWIELVTGAASPAFRGDMAMGERTTLLVGDRMSRARGGPPALEVLEGTEAR